MNDELKSLTVKTGLLVKSVEWIYLHVTSMICDREQEKSLISKHYQELNVQCLRYRNELLELIDSGQGKRSQWLVLYQFLGELWRLGRFCAGIPDSIEIYQRDQKRSEATREVFAMAEEVELLLSRMEDAFLNRDRRQIMELIDSADILKQRFNLLLLDVARKKSNRSSFHVATASEYFKRVLDHIEQMLRILLSDNSDKQE